MIWTPWRKTAARSAAETKSYTLGTSDELGRFLMFAEGSAASASSALSLFERSTAVSIPINWVSEAFSVVTPTLLVDGHVVRRHKILDLLQRPSAWHSTELFFDILAKNYLITGECGLIALGDLNRPPLELVPISPKNMSPEAGSMSDYPDRWTISGRTLTGAYVNGGDGRFIDVRNGLRELMVVRNYSTKDNSLLRGQSPLLSASAEARSHILGTEHNVQILERGGRVSLVFHFDEDMSEDDFEKVKERVRRQYGGATKAGEIGVTAGPNMSVKDIGVSPKDMDFGGLQKIASQAVAMVYRVPLPLISDSRQTLSNFRDSKTALYDDAVIPLSRRILGGLADFLFPRFGLDPRRDTLFIDPDDVSALVSRRNDELLKRRQIGVESPNELRSMIGREPIEGGDTVFQPAAMVPVGSDLFTSDNTQVPDDEDGE